MKPVFSRWSALTPARSLGHSFPGLTVGGDLRPDGVAALERSDNVAEPRFRRRLKRGYSRGVKPLPQLGNGQRTEVSAFHP